MRSSRGLLVCLVVALAWAGAAWGDDYTGATGGNYNVGANWSGGTVPDSDDAAYIRNGATVTLDSSVSSPIQLWVGGPSDAAGAASALHILTGAVFTTTTGSFVVGQQYDGAVTQTGGSIAVPWFRMSGAGTGDSNYALSGGTFISDYQLRGTSPPTWTMDFGRGGGTARFVQTGGYVQLVNNSYWNLGYCGDADRADSLGEFTMTNGSVDISGQAFNIGRSEAGYIGQGKFTLSGGVVVTRYKLQIGYRGTGEFNQSGGLVLADPTNTANQPILLGEMDTQGGASGVYNLSGGSLYIGGNKGLRIGSKYNATYGTGVGLLNVSGGSATMTQGVSVGTKGARGTVLVSNGVVQTGNLVLADNIAASATTAPQAFMRISGGSVGTGGAVIGLNGLGRLEVTGGSLVTPGSMTVGSGDAYGTGTGELKVGANAYVKADSSISFTSANGKLEMEIVSATKNSQVTSGTAIYLNAGVASLTVDSTGYRPKEGDTFTLLTGGSGITGSFSSIGSNITLGLPGGSAFSGAIVSDPTPSTQYYVVTFLGYTAGDATGDSVVDGGDLAVLGGNWGASGISWSGGNFTSPDTIVDGGDLALIGGNWNWSLPPAPGAPLPEPATLALLSLGALAVIRRKSR